MRIQTLLIIFLFTSTFTFGQSTDKLKILNELEKFKIEIKEKAKLKVAEHFVFPNKNSTLIDKASRFGSLAQISILEKNLFLKYYSNIIDKDFENLFSLLNLKLLESKSDIKKIVKLKYKTITYKISIINNRVILSIDDRDIEASSSIIWNFSFENAKLIFEDLVIAG